MLYKTEAIVLRGRPLKEADKIITLYTKEAGKVDAVVKGVRKGSSKFGSKLEIFSYITVMLYRKRVNELETITQVQHIDSFQGIREDIRKIALGSVILELMDKMIIAKEKEQTLFDFLLTTLYSLNKKPDFIILYAFSLKICAFLGLKPQLQFCVKCKGETFDRDVWFSSREGGILCAKCNDILTVGGATSARGATSQKISITTLMVMQDLLRAKFNQLEGISLTSNISAQLWRTINEYVRYCLCASLKSINVVEKMIEE